MRRLFWVGVGAAAGVLLARRVGGIVGRSSAAGGSGALSEGVAGLAAGWRELAAAVREGMHEREEELRFALGLDTHTVPEGLAADGVRRLLEDPSGLRPRPGRT